MSNELEKTIGIIANRNTSKEDIEILLKGARENGIELDSEILYKNLDIVEKERFSYFFNNLRKEYDLPDLNFEIGHFRTIDAYWEIFNNDYYIVLDDTIYGLLLEFSFVLTFYNDLRRKGNIDNEYERRILNHIISTIHVSKILRNIMTENDINERALYNKDSVQEAADIFNAFLCFVCCHEIAHIYLQHNGNQKTFEQEFAADKLGFVFFKYLLSLQNDVAFKLNPNMLYAPLVFFDILGLYDIMRNDLAQSPLNKDEEHPPARERRRKILEKISFAEKKLFYKEYFYYLSAINHAQNHYELFRANIVVNLKKIDKEFHSN